MNFRHALLFLIACSAFLISGCAHTSISRTQQKNIKTLISESWPDPNGPGVAVAVLKDGELVESFMRGVSNIDDPSRITPETNFRIASVTKQFTAMGILILEKQGVLSIDDSITKWLPELSPWADEVTIKHLIHHTSGLKDYESLMRENTFVAIFDDHVVELLAEHPGLDFKSGTEIRYSNSGYACLAMITERASGKSFPNFLRDEIFSPLGMTNSVLFRKGENTVPNRAYGHRFVDDELEMSDQSMTSSVLGDGGIYTSLVEYSKWVQALRNGHEILPSQETMNAVFTSGQLNNGTKTGYGYGWFLEEEPYGKVAWHTGGTRGFNHCVRHHMDDGYTVILFSNRAGTEPKEVCGKISEVISSN